MAVTFDPTGGSFMSLSPAGSLGSEAPPSPRYGFATTAAVTFEAPELPEETLMEVRWTRRWGWCRCWW